MKYFFENKENRDKLKKILESWIGTPFRHQCGVKGLGTDCAYFIANVFIELGLIQWRKDLIPDYPKDWHIHNTRELLKETIEKTLNVIQIDINEEFFDGDIFLFHFGKAASHVAIYFENNLYQALEDVGVIKTYAYEKVFLKRLKYRYRVLA